MARKYQEPWDILKETGRCKVQVTKSDSPAAIARYTRTVRKALQKLKYEDTAFRLKYPNAKLDSVVEGNIVTFTLDTNTTNITELFGDSNE